MFGKNIEFEQPRDQQKRYEKLVENRQRVYEFFWELRETFGVRLFGGLTETALKQLDNARFEDVGRRRFF